MKPLTQEQRRQLAARFESRLGDALEPVLEGRPRLAEEFEVVAMRLVRRILAEYEFVDTEEKLTELGSALAPQIRVVAQAHDVDVPLRRCQRIGRALARYAQGVADTLYDVLGFAADDNADEAAS